MARELRAGRFPLWCDDALGGFPVYADHTTGALNPLRALLLVATPLAAWEIGIAVCLAIAFLGMRWFLRSRGVGEIGATLGALLFAFRAASRDLDAPGRLPLGSRPRAARPRPRGAPRELRAAPPRRVRGDGRRPVSPRRRAPVRGDAASGGSCRPAVPEVRDPGPRRLPRRGARTLDGRLVAGARLAGVERPGHPRRARLLAAAVAARHAREPLPRRGYGRAARPRVRSRERPRRSGDWFPRRAPTSTSRR
jgi:hypothetical protein